MSASIAAPEANFGPAATDYELVVGDVVEFDFLDDEEEPRKLTIGNDGRIQVPLLGGVTVAGMVISEAVATLREQYIQREFLINPNIALSIVDYRPIFVIGDVRSPGSFPFQPLLTVEQAVGLAGGPSTILSNEEDRILTRAKLGSELEENETEIAREAIWAARLVAQLDGRQEISTDDVPEAARPFLNDLFVSALQAVEEQILEVGAIEFETQRSLLTEAITEAERELVLLEDLATNQRVTIQFERDELERVRALFSQGLMTSSEVSRVERQSSSEEDRLLTILTQISQSHRGIGDLRGELSALGATRHQDALLQFQERQVNIEQLLARRRAIEDQLFLVTSWTSEEAADKYEAVIDYTIRRRTGDRFEDYLATSVSTLAPGDVLTVAIDRAAANTGSLQ